MSDVVEQNYREQGLSYLPALVPKQKFVSFLLFFPSSSSREPVKYKPLLGAEEVNETETIPTFKEFII